MRTRLSLSLKCHRNPILVVDPERKFFLHSLYLLPMFCPGSVNPDSAALFDFTDYTTSPRYPVIEYGSSALAMISY